MANKSPAKKVAKNPWVTERVETKFTGVSVFRTQKSGGFWYFSCWLKEEQRYFTKSLRVKDKEEALRLAEEEYIELRSLQKSGKKILPVKLSELITEYLKFQKERVTKQLITPGRLVTITSQIRALEAFLPPNSRLNSIDPKDFLKYTDFRRGRGVKDHTIQNERATINSLFRYGVKIGFCNAASLPEFDELRAVPIARRDAFTIEEYRKIYTELRSWCGVDTHDLPAAKRAVFREFVLISANSGIRFGEARRLKWRNITKIYKITGKDAPYQAVAEIHLPANITKTRKERTVVASAGDFLKRLKATSHHTGLNDFVFADPQTGLALGKNFYYRCWNEVMERAGLADRDPKLTPYSLRHFYATTRLLKGVNIYDLSKNMGCSVGFIEQHYSHVTTPEIAARITKTPRQDKDQLKEILDW